MGPFDASTTRILDVGTGAGVLIPYFETLGAAQGNVTGVDVSPGMLEVARRRYPEATFWEGDVVDFPTSVPPGASGSGKDGLFDAVVFNAVFGNLFDQQAAVEAVGTLAARGARVVIRCVGCVGVWVWRSVVGHLDDRPPSFFGGRG